jgi:hypothetical protein
MEWKETLLKNTAVQFLLRGFILTTIIWNFLFPPPWLFFPPRISVFAPNFKLRNAFSKFFLPWIRTSECIFWSFRWIWTRKTSENTFRSFCTRVKFEYWGVKKSHAGRGEENISHYLLIESFSVWALSFIEK